MKRIIMPVSDKNESRPTTVELTDNADIAFLELTSGSWAMADCTEWINKYGTEEELSGFMKKIRDYANDVKRKGKEIIDEQQLVS